MLQKQLGQGQRSKARGDLESMACVTQGCCVMGLFPHLEEEGTISLCRCESPVTHICLSVGSRRAELHGVRQGFQPRRRLLVSSEWRTGVLSNAPTADALIRNISVLNSRCREKPSASSFGQYRSIKTSRKINVSRSLCIRQPSEPELVQRATGQHEQPASKARNGLVGCDSMLA